MALKKNRFWKCNEFLIHPGSEQKKFPAKLIFGFFGPLEQFLFSYTGYHTHFCHRKVATSVFRPSTG